MKTYAQSARGARCWAWFGYVIAVVEGLFAVLDLLGDQLIPGLVMLFCAVITLIAADALMAGARRLDLFDDSDAGGQIGFIGGPDAATVDRTLRSIEAAEQRQGR